MKPGPSSVPAPRTLGPWIIAAAILVLAALVVVVSARLRLSLREQVLLREAESMHALVSLQQRLAEDEWAQLGAAMPADDRLAVVLQTTKLRGVVAVRIYEPTGLLHAALPAVVDEALAGSDWLELEEGRPVARLTTHASLLAEWEDMAPPGTPVIPDATATPDVTATLDGTVAPRGTGVPERWAERRTETGRQGVPSPLEGEERRSRSPAETVAPGTEGVSVRAGAAEPKDRPLAATNEAAGEGVPVLEVIVPLEDPVLVGLAGAAQFLIDPAGVQAQFAAIDRGVLQQALLALVGGGLLLGGLLTWAFARLAAAQGQLRRQAEDLRRANDELLLSAKVSAIGAISAHLLHGLRNPLAGIDGFVRAGASGEGPEAADGDAWREAAETTRRLRTMVNEATALIAAERTAGAPDLSADDVVQGAVARTAESARRAPVTVQAGPVDAADLDGRVASLGGLVLVNLLENAVQASPPGAAVRITAAATPTTVAFDVTDHGAGLAPAVRENLFRPVASTKPGGGGIGLALSHELARLAGGSLELVSTSAAGTTFRLTLPRAGVGAT